MSYAKLIAQLRETGDDWPACLLELELAAADAITVLELQVRDLAMLVKMLAKYAPDERAAQALNFLWRHNLQGSPLRDEDKASVK